MELMVDLKVQWLSLEQFYSLKRENSTFQSTVSTKTPNLSRTLQKVQKEDVSCWEPTMNDKLGFLPFQLFSSER